MSINRWVEWCNRVINALLSACCISSVKEHSSCALKSLITRLHKTSFFTKATTLCCQWEVKLKSRVEPVKFFKDLLLNFALSKVSFFETAQTPKPYWKVRAKYKLFQILKREMRLVVNGQNTAIYLGIIAHRKCYWLGNSTHRKVQLNRFW